MDEEKENYKKLDLKCIYCPNGWFKDMVSEDKHDKFICQDCWNKGKRPFSNPFCDYCTLRQSKCMC